MALTEEDKQWIQNQLERVETRVLAEIYRSRSRSAIQAIDAIEMLIDRTGGSKGERADR
jgi:hypothetical protein